MSLLGKWLWKLWDNLEGQWMTIIRDKYIVEGGCWSVNVSELWKGVLTTVDYFYANIIYRAGQGNKFLFWKDSWCQWEPLSSQFQPCSELLIPECSNVGCMVCQGNSVSSWPTFRRSLNDREEEDLSNLFQTLSQVYVSLHRSDRCIWKLEIKDIFTVKSFFSLLFCQMGRAGRGGDGCVQSGRFINAKSPFKRAVFAGQLVKTKFSLFIIFVEMK